VGDRVGIDTQKAKWTWWGEMGGAVGDLGLMVPLAFALVATNGIPAPRLAFLWGAAYVVTGLFFRVPVSIQPLKAMAVIALATGYGADMLTTAAFGYGVFFVLLAATGLVTRLKRFFTPGLVRGVQLGIGLMLARKAIDLLLESPFFLTADGSGGALVVAACALALVVLLVGGRLARRPLALPMLVMGVAAGWLAGVRPDAAVAAGSPLEFTLPVWHLLPNAALLLMLPQLPLTLGNAVIAADDACHLYWRERSRRVSVKRLAASIGLSNIVIGLAGGFPVCHGAGGIAAHARFGGRTGRATVLMGSVMIGAALIPGGTSALFMIPVPILGALLLMVSWEMIRLLGTLPLRRDLAVALTTGVVAFVSRNLAIALVAGWALERVLFRISSIRAHA
jgi:sulfate permease, SulP family